MRKPIQPILGIVAPSQSRPTLKDRGYGTTETPQQRTMRLARARAVHETAKYADAGPVLAAVRLRRMP
jgi:hypothetical protein